ncbi:MAG: thiol reductant ABC exporter subunit CydD [Steroidobacteraceae bacterium]
MNSPGAADSPPTARRAAEWLRREARVIRGPLLRTALFTALLALALVAQAWVLAGILAAGVIWRDPIAQLWPLWLALLVLALLRFALNILARRSAVHGAQQLAGALRARLLRGAQALGPLGLRSHASGDLITRLVDGIEAVLVYFARYLPQAGAAVLVPLLLAVFVFPADWLSGLILVLTAPLIPLFMVLVGRAAARASEQRHAQLQRLGAAFVDALAGLVTLRQLGAGERFAVRVQSESEAYGTLSLQVLRIAFLSSLVLEFFAMVSIAIVAVLIGFRLLWGELALRDGLFVLFLAPEFYLQLRGLGALRHTRMDALASAEQLAGLEADAVAVSAPSAGTAPVRCGHPPQIRLEGVAYLHPGRGAGLHECSFTIRPAQLTALVGASGSGKSTLLNLLLGFAAPDRGRILLDGVDLAGCDLGQWRECIAWVPQSTHVFEGTVRENLLLANREADAAALNRALEASGLAAALARLPQGADTELGERGIGLSGGQLQRLALARAWVRERATVWLLDEPTAHLDRDGAREIQGAIRAAAGSRTVLMAVHRLSAACAADWVVVLDGGRVVEQGPPELLQRTGGAFSALLQAQRS